MNMVGMLCNKNATVHLTILTAFLNYNQNEINDENKVLLQLCIWAMLQGCNSLVAAY